MAILIILSIFLLIYLAVVVKLAWEGYQRQKAVDNFQASIEKPFREDVYGGKTPEETWAMFLDALKKGDIDLASKYFVVDKQAEWKEKIKTIMDKGKLNTILKNFSTFEKEGGIQNDKAYYHIKMPFPESESGFIYSPVVFYLNPYTKVWKIIIL